MAKIHSYPRVKTSITALKRSNARPEAEDTTTLFMPFVSDKGPANRIEKIHSLEEFENTFGISNNFDRMPLTYLNIANWLTAGGTLYAYRLVGEGKTVASGVNDEQAGVFVSGVFTATAKYPGKFYNDLSVQLNKNENSDKLYIRVFKDGYEVEYFRIPFKKGKNDVKNISEYIGEINNTSDSDVLTYSMSKVVIPLSGGTDGFENESDVNNALLNFWQKEVLTVLGNPLETPVELIMDAGYAMDIKKAMAEFVIDDDLKTRRPDIRCILEMYDSTVENSEAAINEDFGDLDDYKSSNLAVYAQRFLISEEIYAGKDMYVGPTYFLSQLMPANDILYGLQFTTSGKRRGVLNGVKEISYNPMPDQKDKLFNKRINYVEKDSRGYYFMSQRTFDNSTEDNFTALSFLNNSLVVCRMVHELERLGRDYLFEFNDAVTLSNMSSVLNKYVSNWISNRTLSFGNVVVTKNAYSDEAVDVTLNIKFTRTIEVISIDLIIG